MGLERLDERFNQVQGCIVILRCLISVPILVVGILIALALKDSGYYALVEEEEGWMPYCQAILYKEDIEGHSIDFGTYGSGSSAYSWGKFESPELTVQRVETATGTTGATAKISDAQTLATENCRLIIPQIDSCPEFCKQCDTLKGSAAHKWELKTCEKNLEGSNCACSDGGQRYLLIDGTTGKEVVMRGMCGGESKEPRLWLLARDQGQRTLEEISRGPREPKTFAPAPCIACLGVWFLLRMLQVGLEFAKMSGFNSEGGSLIFNIGSYIIFAWTGGILLSPIHNLQANEACPQLITTYFSSVTQIAMAGAGVVLLINIAVVGNCVKQDVGEDQAHKQMGALLAMNLCDLNGNVYFFIPIILIVLGSCIYKVYVIINVSFYEIFAFTFDLTIRWPQFKLAASTNAFHILTFILFVSDVLGLLNLTLVKPGLKCVFSTLGINIENKPKVAIVP